MRPPRRLSALLLLFSAVGFSRETIADQPSQSDVEAVYLFDFGKFVRWPAGADQGPLRLCVAGGESFQAGLQRIAANENINGRSLDVRRARPSCSPPSPPNPHLPSAISQTSSSAAA